MADSQRKQLRFIAEGEKVERDLIKRAMRAFGVDSERFAILIFGTTVHQLIEEIVGEGGAFEADFESVDMKLVLADMLETGRGTLSGIDYHGVATHTAGDAAWLRTAKYV